jgi:hypothetical protein
MVRERDSLKEFFRISIRRDIPKRLRCTEPPIDEAKSSVKP